MSDPAIIPLHDRQALSWQQQLQGAIRTAEDLANAVGLSLDSLPYSGHADRDFPLLVPRAFAARMETGNADDPLLRQVLSAPDELTVEPGYTADPVGEKSRYADAPGLIQKYHGRALLVATGHCAVNCRYCFRRHYPYTDNTVSSEQRLAQIDELLKDPDLRELILSGGDPLVLPDAQLAAVAKRVAAHHGRVTLRVHTRLPIVIPDRVNDALIGALCQPGLPLVVVVHANHPNEIDGATADSLRALRDAGATVLNQSVLLAGINDDPQALAALSERLFTTGVLPYYLHQLDPVAGAAHFAVGDQKAREIVGELASRLPGYLVPRLVREVPGARSKQELSPSYPS